MISILILTLNEQQNIADCIKSVSWADQIVVLDSCSSDATAEIATKAGATVVQHKFENWAAHQNWAMEQIPWKNPWVFYLDADERMTDELRAEISAIAADDQEKRVAFYCGRKNYFMGKWIRHAMPPSNIVRFFKPSSVRFERLVNPKPVISGPHGYLKNVFLHYNFSKGLAEWYQKHNNYSSLEAIETVKSLDAADFHFRELFATDRMIRRMAKKQLSFRLPARSLFKFIYLYIIQLGFLDGVPGLQYCVLQAFYEHQITLKVREILLQREGGHF